MRETLAYLITWTTYGTWLPGDERGWIKSGVEGVQEADPRREVFARRAMTGPCVVLETEQRKKVDSTIRRHCQIREWELHALNVRTNHVHLVVTAPVTPEEVMNQLKAWCSRRLNETVSGGEPRRRKWWTEHGSTRWIHHEGDVLRAIEYVTEEQ